MMREGRLDPVVAERLGKLPMLRLKKVIEEGVVGQQDLKDLMPLMDERTRGRVGLVLGQMGNTRELGYQGRPKGVDPGWGKKLMKGAEDFQFRLRNLVGKAEELGSMGNQPGGLEQASEFARSRLREIEKVFDPNLRKSQLGPGAISKFQAVQHVRAALEELSRVAPRHADALVGQFPKLSGAFREFVDENAIKGIQARVEKTGKPWPSGVVQVPQGKRVSRGVRGLLANAAAMKAVGEGRLTEAHLGSKLAWSEQTGSGGAAEHVERQLKNIKETSFRWPAKAYVSEGQWLEDRQDEPVGAPSKEEQVRDTLRGEGEQAAKMRKYEESLTGGFDEKRMLPGMLGGKKAKAMEEGVLRGMAQQVEGSAGKVVERKLAAAENLKVMEMLKGKRGAEVLKGLAKGSDRWGKIARLLMRVV